MIDIEIPTKYNDISLVLRQEIEESFKVYFSEELLDVFCRGVYDADDVALDEVEEEAKDYINKFLMERLMDEF